MKTKSICKGKFKITGTGKLTYKAVGKRHNMSKRSNKQINNVYQVVLSTMKKSKTG